MRLSTGCGVHRLTTTAVAGKEEAEEVLIGWKGETYAQEPPQKQVRLPTQRNTQGRATAWHSVGPLTADDSLFRPRRTVTGRSRGKYWRPSQSRMKAHAYAQAEPRLAADLLLGCRVETISWSPRAFVYHNFLTQEECDHLVKIGQQRVRAHVYRAVGEYCRASMCTRCCGRTTHSHQRAVGSGHTRSTRNVEACCLNEMLT